MHNYFIFIIGFTEHYVKLENFGFSVYQFSFSFINEIISFFINPIDYFIQYDNPLMFHDFN